MLTCYVILMKRRGMGISGTWGSAGLGIRKIGVWSWKGFDLNKGILDAKIGA